LPEPAALSEDRLMKEYKLMLECYHPLSKLSEPHVFCKYIGTNGLNDRYEDQGSLYENLEAAQKLGRLTSLYSRFRPEAAAEERGSGGPSSGRMPVSVTGFVRLTMTVMEMIQRGLRR
jgi:hypothetical protein